MVARKVKKAVEKNSTRKPVKRLKDHKKVSEILDDVVVTVDTSKVNPDDVLGRDRLRLEAGMVYVTSLKAISVTELHSQPRFNGIPLQTLAKWANEDKWVQRRKEMFASLREGLEKRLRESLTDQVYTSVQSLRKLKGMAEDKLTAIGPNGKPMLKARSWEGVAKIFMEADKRLDEYRQTMNDDPMALGFAPKSTKQLPETTEETSNKPAMRKLPEYDPAELRKLAKQLTKKRRDEIRGNAEAQKAEK